MALSSTDINLLVYRYLQESGNAQQYLPSFQIIMCSDMRSFMDPCPKHVREDSNPAHHVIRFFAHSIFVRL